jgi:hypothetical protein
MGHDKIDCNDQSNAYNKYWIIGVGKDAVKTMTKKQKWATIRNFNKN